MRSAWRTRAVSPSSAARTRSLLEREQLLSSPPLNSRPSGLHEQAVTVWDVATGEAVQVFRGHTAAVKNVTAIRKTYEEKVAQAPAAEKGRLVDEATTAMTKAVTDQGLSVDEYVSIIEVAQNDPAIRDKLLQKLK